MENRKPVMIAKLKGMRIKLNNHPSFLGYSKQRTQKLFSK